MCLHYVYVVTCHVVDVSEPENIIGVSARWTVPLRSSPIAMLGFWCTFLCFTVFGDFCCNVAFALLGCVWAFGAFCCNYVFFFFFCLTISISMWSDWTNPNQPVFCWVGLVWVWQRIRQPDPNQLAQRLLFWVIGLAKPDPTDLSTFPNTTYAHWTCVVSVLFWTCVRQLRYNTKWWYISCEGMDKIICH